MYPLGMCFICKLSLSTWPCCDLTSKGSWFSFLFFSFLFCLCQAAYGILVPRPGTELAPSAVKAHSPNLCTTRELPGILIFKSFLWLVPLPGGPLSAPSLGWTRIKPMWAPRTRNATFHLRIRTFSFKAPIILLPQPLTESYFRAAGLPWCQTNDRRLVSVKLSVSETGERAVGSHPLTRRWDEAHHALHSRACVDAQTSWPVITNPSYSVSAQMLPQASCDIYKRFRNVFDIRRPVSWPSGPSVLTALQPEACERHPQNPTGQTGFSAEQSRSQTMTAYSVQLFTAEQLLLLFTKK